MRYFVTGGSGFVGKRLIATLIGQGHAVYALARSELARRQVSDAGAEPLPGCLGDVAALEVGMRRCDAVFHCAGLVEFFGRDEDLYRVNVLGTANVVAAAQSAKVGCLVHVSAAAVISNGGRIRAGGGDASTSTVPFGAYARTKLDGERRVRDANGPALRAVVIRPPLVWGPGDSGFLPEIIRAVRRHQFVWIDGGRYPYATCHVDNLIEALLLAAQRGRGGAAYFVTDGRRQDFRDFVSDLLAMRGIRPPRLGVPRGSAWWGAAMLERIWWAFNLAGRPPITRTLLALIGNAVEIDDGDARRDLGYRGATRYEAALQELRQSPDRPQ